MSRPKPTFFTADWHLGHKASLLFDKRPFRDLAHMHQFLINNYNATVPDDGICYFLGDMGFGGGDVVKDVISQLKGTKIMVLGNHDKGLTATYNMGFDAVMSASMLIIAGERVTMTHCPLKGVLREDTFDMKGSIDGENWHGETRHNNFSISNFGQFHLHGHIHSPNRGKSSKILGKQYDVGVPGNSYRPVSQSVIESWITKHKKESPF